MNEKKMCIELINDILAKLNLETLVAIYKFICFLNPKNQSS